MSTQHYLLISPYTTSSLQPDWPTLLRKHPVTLVEVLPTGRRAIIEAKTEDMQHLIHALGNNYTSHPVTR